jgi:hypothetical protein
LRSGPAEQEVDALRYLRSGQHLGVVEDEHDRPGLFGKHGGEPGQQ